MCRSTRRSRVSRPTAGSTRNTKCSPTRTRCWDLIDQGAQIFVCGNARTLAPGVRAALQQIYADKTAGTADEAEQWLAGLRREHRYLEDIWGAN